jgi:hypothetical protein
MMAADLSHNYGRISTQHVRSVVGAHEDEDEDVRASSRLLPKSDVDKQTSQLVSP